MSISGFPTKSLFIVAWSNWGLLLVVASLQRGDKKKGF